MSIFTLEYLGASLVAFWICYGVLHRLRPYLQPLWAKWIAKLWIDFLVIGVIVALGLLMIPIQNEPQLLVFTTIIYGLVTYRYLGTSVGDIAFIPPQLPVVSLRNTRPKRAKRSRRIFGAIIFFTGSLPIFGAWITIHYCIKWLVHNVSFRFREEKNTKIRKLARRQLRRSIGIIVVSVFLLAIMGKGLKLDNSTFTSYEGLEGMKISEVGGIIFDNADLGWFDIGLYDDSENGVYETLKQDVNGDGMIDIVEIDDNEDGIVDRAATLTYDTEKGTMRFIFLVTIIFLTVLRRRQKKKGKLPTLVLLLPLLLLLSTPSFADDWDEYQYNQVGGGRETCLNNCVGNNDDTDFYMACMDYCEYGSTAPAPTQPSQPTPAPQPVYQDYGDDNGNCGAGAHWEEGGCVPDVDIWEEPTPVYEDDNDWDREEPAPTQKPTPQPTPAPQPTVQPINTTPPPTPTDQTKKSQELVKDVGLDDQKGNISQSNQKAQDNYLKDILDYMGVNQDQPTDEESLFLLAVKDDLSGTKDWLDVSSKLFEVTTNLISSKLLKYAKDLGKDDIRSLQQLRGSISKLQKTKGLNITGVVKDKKVAMDKIKKGKNFKQYQKAKKSAGTTRKMFKAAGKALDLGGDALSLVADYYEFKEAYKGDEDKAMAAAGLNTIINKVVSKNPVDAAVGLFSAGLKVLGFQKAGDLAGKFTAGDIAKNAVNHAGTTTEEELKQIIHIKLKEARDAKGVLKKSWKMFDAGVTSTYTAGVYATKKTLNVATAGVKKIKGGVSRMYNGVTGWFKASPKPIPALESIPSA